MPLTVHEAAVWPLSAGAPACPPCAKAPAWKRAASAPHAASVSAATPRLKRSPPIPFPSASASLLQGSPQDSIPDDIRPDVDKTVTRPGCSAWIGLEAQRDAVHAIAQPCRLGPIRKDVPQMTAASRAVHFSTPHEKTVIRRGLYSALDRRPEARPTRAALKFRVR